MPWTPCFNPLTIVLSHAPVWVRNPNLPLNVLGESSLKSIGSTLGKYHFASKEIEIHNIISYAKICVEIEFSKGVKS
jgi:hypothetical protein